MLQVTDERLLPYLRDARGNVGMLLGGVLTLAVLFLGVTHPPGLQPVDPYAGTLRDTSLVLPAVIAIIGFIGSLLAWIVLLRPLRLAQQVLSTVQPVRMSVQLVVTRTERMPTATWMVGSGNIVWRCRLQRTIIPPRSPVDNPPTITGIDWLALVRRVDDPAGDIVAVELQSPLGNLRKLNGICGEADVYLPDDPLGMIVIDTTKGTFLRRM